MLRCCFYIILLTLFSFIACQNNAPEPTTATMPEINQESKFSYLALGDSYTIGESVLEADQWGMQLVGLLRQKGVAVSDPVTIARTGWTTAELTSAVAAAELNDTFSLVSLLIGVNNQYRGQSLATYRTEFKELLQTAIRFADNRSTNVIVLSIPDWGATPFAQGSDQTQIAQEIDAFNLIAQEESQAAGVTFINITPLTRQFGTDLTYLAADRLHYSGKMHLEWAKLALPAAQNILK